MGETIALTVTEARARLRDTSRLSSDQIDDLQRIVGRFHATRPVNRACVACGCARWSEHYTSDGGVAWGCAGCHKVATLTADDWRAEQRREREAAEAHLKAAAAAAPKPRVVLREALARLADARGTLSKLDRAAPTARAGVVSAQELHDAATAALAEAEAASAEHVAASIFEGKRPAPATATATARAALAQAVDGLVIARNAKAILDSRLNDARSAVDYANNRARKAARAVIAAEKLEELIADVIEYKAGYLESVGQLGWLVRNHAIAGDQQAARQLVADANTPPSAWPEAKTAGTQQMESALAALMADAEAVI